MGFGNLLRAMRRQHGWTQQQLADRAHISVRTLLYWETGRREPRNNELSMALNALQATAEQCEQLYQQLTGAHGAKATRSYLESQNPVDVLLPGLPSLGALLAALRHRQGWRRERLAAEMGVHIGTLRRWEIGETMPGVERLRHLCALLNARPDEQEALLQHRQLPAPHVEEDTYEAWSLCVWQFEELSQIGDFALSDLHALALKRQLWLRARHNPTYRSLLGVLESIYCSCLLRQDRLREAEACADSALRLVSVAADTERFLFIPLGLMSYLVYRRSNENCGSAIDLLNHWLPRIRQPDVRERILCNLAVYLAMDCDHDSATAHLEQARDLLSCLQGLSADQVYFRLTQARVCGAGWKSALSNLDAPHYSLMSLSTSSTSLLMEARERQKVPQHLHRRIYADLERLPDQRIQVVAVLPDFDGKKGLSRRRISSNRCAPDSK